mgnify:CR=1 FL=1
MKKIMIFSAIFAVAISLSACSNNETDISYASAETITLSSTTLNFEKEGGTQTAEVESTHEFAAYSNDSWIKVTPTNPVGKKATITVTVGENQGAERTATSPSGRVAHARTSPSPRPRRTEHHLPYRGLQPRMERRVQRQRIGTRLDLRDQASRMGEQRVAELRARGQGGTGFQRNTEDQPPRRWRHHQERSSLRS